MRTAIFSCLLVACAGQLYASDALMIRAIGIVESGMNRDAVGDNGRAVGAYQMHPEAWEDANAHLRSQGRTGFPRYAWRDPGVQDCMALAYLAVIRKRLRSMGVENPSTGVLALCWNRGPEGARSQGFAVSPYAKRVVSIRQSLPIK